MGQFASALECYSRSVELEPGCVAFANRAMARLKLEQWEGAEQDCTQVRVRGWVLGGWGSGLRGLM